MLLAKGLLCWSFELSVALTTPFLTDLEESIPLALAYISCCNGKAVPRMQIKLQVHWPVALTKKGCKDNLDVTVQEKRGFAA